MKPELHIRRLAPAEWVRAFPVVMQLRPHLDEAEFIARARRQSYSGYELIAAFDGDRVVGVLGMRPVHTLARGAHLHVDDLVTDEAARSRGVGQALMAYAEADARSRGMTALFLDARKEAIPFYQRVGYDLNPAPLMKKVL